MDMTPSDLEAVLESAGLGGWELDLQTQTLTWTALTRLIHEVPADYAPQLSDALSFYPPGIAPLMQQAVETAVAEGTPWSLDVPFTTATGRSLWVRATGRAVLEQGHPVRLVGAFQDITERHLAALEMQRLSVVARQMTNAVLITGLDGRVEWVNDAFSRLSGYDMAEVVGRRPGSVLQGPETDAATVSMMRQALASCSGFGAELLNYRKDGTPYWISLLCSPLIDSARQITGFIAVGSDVTDRRRAEASMAAEIVQREAAENLLRDVLDALPDGVMAFDPQERLVLVNAAHRELFSVMAPAMVLGRTLEEVVGYALAHGQYADVGETPDERAAWLAGYLASLRNPGPRRTLRLPAGGYVQARERRSASGNLVCVRTDVTRLQQAEAEVRRQAERDALTGLVNRTVLAERLAGELAARRDGDGAGGALVLLDVDHFKTINDTLGHDVGDMVLMEVAGRLHNQTRHGDTVARLGGDEFALLLPHVRGEGDILTVTGSLLNRLQGGVSQPVVCGERRVVPSISMGMALYPRDGDDVQLLLKNADLALYEAKRRGRARWCQFDHEQAKLRSRRQQVATDLRNALADNLLFVELQPKLHLTDRRHAGFEALARWNHQGVRVRPDEFIPVAEDTGLIVPLGRFVLDRSLAAMRSLLDRGLQPGTVAVNIAALQLASDTFVDDVEQMLVRHHLSPDALEVEVTETVLLDRSADRIERSLRGLRHLGVRLALDDFGTGYASLVHLRRFPVQRLKIDRSFITRMDGASEDGIIVRTIISLAHGLGMDVVAEGVETEAQLEYLRAQGCDDVQGYLIARPLSLSKAADYLAGFVQRTSPEMPTPSRWMVAFDSDATA